MKRGDSITCPQCREKTIAKEKVVMDGWKASGKILVCPLCNGKVGDIELETTMADTKNSKALFGLSALLATEAEVKPQIKVAVDEKQFCRDCKHYMAHPFLSRCSLHKKEVNPMDDCPDFELSKEKN
ncbi:MAG: hypothetical protein WC071_04585 [Victivallaceae bacterium]